MDKNARMGLYKYREWLMKELKFKDIYGITHTIEIADIRGLTRETNTDTNQPSTGIDTGVSFFIADCPLEDFITLGNEANE